MFSDSSDVIVVGCALRCGFVCRTLRDMASDIAFCPVCGGPAGIIACPVCGHDIWMSMGGNLASFCIHCGSEVNTKEPQMLSKWKPGVRGPTKALDDDLAMDVLSALMGKRPTRLDKLRSWGSPKELPKPPEEDDEDDGEEGDDIPPRTPVKV